MVSVSSQTRLHRFSLFSRSQRKTTLHLISRPLQSTAAETISRCLNVKQILYFLMTFWLEDRKSDACTTIVSCLVDGKHERGVLNKDGGVDFSSFLYLVTLVLNLVVWFVSSDLSDEWAQRWAGDFELNPDLHLPAENKFIGQYKHKLWSLDKIHRRKL